jgi:MFS family permease
MPHRTPPLFGSTSEVVALTLHIYQRHLVSLRDAEPYDRSGSDTSGPFARATAKSPMGPAAQGSRSAASLGCDPQRLRRRRSCPEKVVFHSPGLVRLRLSRAARNLADCRQTTLSIALTLCAIVLTGSRTAAIRCGCLELNAHARFASGATAVHSSALEARRPPLSPDVRRAFRILFLCLTCIGIGQSMLFAILPPAARTIGLSPFQVSTIFATSATIWVFVSPMWGRRSDVWGRRPVILIGLLGFAASMALLAVMIQIGLAGALPLLVLYPLMVASRCVFALFGSGAGPASQAYVADRTDRSQRTAGVAMVNAALGLGQALGPALGAGLVIVGLLVPLYFSAVLAVLSALLIWLLLPEEKAPLPEGAALRPRLRFWDARVLPFIAIGASLQAVQATNAIVLAFFLQDTLGLTAPETVQYAGVGFMVLAVSGLFAQLVLVQRFRPSAASMLRWGMPLILLSMLILVIWRGFIPYLLALSALGLGLGLARPGNAAGASLCVKADEQGSVAGLIGGIAVVGNIVGPMLGTGLYALNPLGPYLLDAVLMAGMALFAWLHPRLRTVGA